jgi:hypothetical protein
VESHLPGRRQHRRRFAADYGTPAQLAQHLQDAIHWTKNNPDLNPANAIIVYAWNENDEGGWRSRQPENRIMTLRREQALALLTAWMKNLKVKPPVGSQDMYFASARPAGRMSRVLMARSRSSRRSR